MSMNLSIRVAVVGACGTDNLIAHRIDRADIIDDATLEADRQFLAFVQHLRNALCAASRPVSILPFRSSPVARFPAGNDLGR